MDLQERIAQLSPKQRAILERKLKKAPVRTDGPASPAVARRARAYAPLSFAQERLWFLQQLEPDSPIYNLPALAPLPGPAEQHAVEDSIRQVVARHGGLRTRFVVKGDTPYQVVDDDVQRSVDFATIELGSHGGRRSATIDELLGPEIWVPFNLSTGPLLRVRLVRGGAAGNWLLVVMHHIVADGWSLEVFLKEFRIFYDAAIAGATVTLPPVGQYIDFAESQREDLRGAKLARLLSYWRRQVEDAPPLIELPLDRPRPARQSYRGGLYPFDVSTSALDNLRRVCRDCGVVPFMVVLSAFKVLLFRLTNQANVVVATPIANRNRSDLEPVIGFFANTLVLVTSLSPEMTFRQVVGAVREIALAAYEHQDLPFEKLVSELQPARSLSHNPLFQVMFNFLNLAADRPAVGDRVPAPAPLPVPAPLPLPVPDGVPAKFDLTLAVTEGHDSLSAVFEYATDLFDRETIERLAGHFLNVLEQMLAHPDDEIAGFSMLSEPEAHQILSEWNDTERPWDEILTLPERFHRSVESGPDATAMIFKGRSLTYRELDRRANAVAWRLNRQGVGPGKVVGLCVSRSVAMVVGLVGIIKAGAAYLPIDPEFPSERIAFLLDDAGVDVVVTSPAAAAVVASRRMTTLVVDDIAGDEEASAPPAMVGPRDAAYVLYTSGSTGRPKGVVVSHRAIHNRLRWMQDEYRLSPGDRVMQKTPFTFDVSVWEFFWTLSEGATLVVPEPGRHKESTYLVDLIVREGVTCLHFVPSMLQAFLCEDLSGCTSLRLVICSGEAMTIDQVRRLGELPGVSAHNLYGPTEAAIDVTHWDCSNWRDQYLSVPIGRPIANTQIYVLNEKCQPVPVGVVGELHIGGVNLADGYLNNAEATRRAFVGNPFSLDPGSRLYKTGDLARYRRDGCIEFVGRADSQIKLRGVRIELGEVEFALRQHPEIAGAAAVVSRLGKFDERLVAYVVPADRDVGVDLAGLRAFLSRKLPSYMVPAVVMALPALPLTASGKLDRAALPAAAGTTTSGAAGMGAPEPVGPADEIEDVILAIWRRFLKVGEVGTTDDFFAVGGHSILAFQVTNSISRHFRMEVPVRLLFENPTVRSLATALRADTDDAWRADSMATADLLQHSTRRTLLTIDDLGEEVLDEILARHLGGSPIEKLAGTDEAIAWAHAVVATLDHPAGENNRDRPPAEQRPAGTHPEPSGLRRPPPVPADRGDPDATPFAQIYPELWRAAAALHRLRSSTGPTPAAAQDGASDAELMADRLRRQCADAFAGFVEVMRMRATTDQPAAPDLRTYWAEIRETAQVADWLRSW